MPIVSSSVVLSHNWPDGRKLVVCRYTFDTGRAVDVESVLPQAQDMAEWMAARTPELEQGAADSEINQILNGG